MPLVLTHLLQQLGDVALQVVHRLAHLPGAAVADMAGVHAVGAAGEDIGLQRDAELPAIVDDMHMVVRDAAGPDIEPQPLVELAHLRRRVRSPSARRRGGA